MELPQLHPVSSFSFTFCGYELKFRKAKLRDIGQVDVIRSSVEGQEVKKALATLSIFLDYEATDEEKLNFIEAIEIGEDIEKIVEDLGKIMTLVGINGKGESAPKAKQA